MSSSAFNGHTSRRSVRIARSAVLSAMLLAFAAPSAHATLRVVNQNDPAGDPTLITYRLLQPPSTTPLVPDFQLGDAGYRSFGVKPGTYVIQANIQPTGWHVVGIECVGGPNPNDFVKDVANGRVTVTHEAGAEQTCTFKNSRVAGSGSSSSPQSSPISPIVPPSELPKVTLPKGPALVRVTAGRGFATATVRITRRSVIRCQLLRGQHVVGSARVTHSAGTYTVRIDLTKRYLRFLRQHHRKRQLLTLRVVTTAGKATHVFRYRVLVRV
jgi:hypothetical protein